MDIPNSPMNIQSVPEYLVGSLSFEMTSLLISKYIVRSKWDVLDGWEESFEIRGRWREGLWL